MQCGFSSDGHKSRLQLPFVETLDSCARSGPFDASPEIEVHGWWTFGDSVRRRGYVSESLETTFQSFEVVSCASVETSPLLPSLSNAALMVARVMLMHDYEPGMGMGKDGLGNADVVDIRGNPYKYGLGYEPEMSGRRNAPSRLRADRAWPDHVSQ